MTVTPSRLSTVFTVHRFIAGGFGFMLLLLISNEPYEAFYGKPLAWQEKLVTQSWGCTLLMVAWVVHQARSFSHENQRRIAWPLVPCFLIETVLHTSRAFWTEGFSEQDRMVMKALLPIFAALLVAYTWGILEPVRPTKPSTKKQYSLERLTLVFSFHRWMALIFGILAVFWPDALYKPFHESSPSSPTEVFAIQSWGAFILVAAGFAHAAVSFDFEGQIVVGRAMLLQFILLCVVYIATGMQGTLNDMFLYGSLPVFVPMTAAYMWALPSSSAATAAAMSKIE